MIDPNDPKRRELEDFIARYLMFCFLVCVASAILFAGWPALLTWAGLFYGMRFYHEFMFGSGEQPKSSTRKRKPKCRK